MLPNFRNYELDFEGTSIHCMRGGNGPALVLLHGSGAGVDTMSNFKRVLAPLSEKFDVLAADLIGFGQSGLKPTTPFYDMGMWVRQATFLIDQFGGRPVGLVGHSLSGSIVLKAAVNEPRVSGVITTGTTGSFLPVQEGGPRWTFPEGKEAVRKNVERTVFDLKFADDEEVSRRHATIQRPGYKAYFESMFEKSRKFYLDEAALSDEALSDIKCPVILMHGLNDRSFTPEETSLVLARKIPNANVIAIGNCAHSVALEYPELFVKTLSELFIK